MASGGERLAPHRETECAVRSGGGPDRIASGSRRQCHGRSRERRVEGVEDGALDHQGGPGIRLQHAEAFSNAIGIFPGPCVARWLSSHR